MPSEFSSSDLRTVGNYQLGRLIGKGSFGKVYLASHKLTNGSKVCYKGWDCGEALLKDDGRLCSNPQTKMTRTWPAKSTITGSSSILISPGSTRL